MIYVQAYNPNTGRFLGVNRTDDSGITSFVPQDTANSDWNAFLAWNAAQQPPLSLADIAPTARKPRNPLAVYQDLLALTAQQQANVWADLSALVTVGTLTVKKYLTDAGPSYAGIAALDWAANDAGATGVALTRARMRVAMIYVIDNPVYLVHPAFDATINIPGDALA